MQVYNDEMTKKENSAQAWIDDRVAYINGLQKPKEHQHVLANLAEKAITSKLDINEEKLFQAVLTLEKCEVKVEAAMAALVRVKNPHTAAQRALETKKKTIVGGYLATHDPKLFEKIVSKLTRPQDRAIFGLPPLLKKAPGQ